jgi:hypothetical protein
MSRIIEDNGKIPKSWDEFVNSMILKEVCFDSVKRERFNENSALIKLLDSYLQEQNKKGQFILPELKTLGNESIAIFSDYGGEHKGSKYSSYTFLFCGWNHCWHVGEEFKRLRDKFDLNGKEISFKDLDYGPTQRVLDEYLNTLDRKVFGFLLTVLIEKELPTLFLAKENQHLVNELENNGMGKWHLKTAEKLMRILHLIGYVLPLLAESNQKIIWMTDKDPVVANDEMFKNALQLLKAVMKIYSDNSYKTVGGAKLPFSDKNVHTMDLLSITDLVSGSVEQYFSVEKKEGVANVKPGAEKVIKWLSTPGDFLQKEVVRVYKEGNEIKIEGIKFNTE